MLPSISQLVFPFKANYFHQYTVSYLNSSSTDLVVIVVFLFPCALFVAALATSCAFDILSLKHRPRAKPTKDIDKELVPTQPDNVEESEEESDWGGYDISIGSGDGDSTITEDLPIPDAVSYLNSSSADLVVIVVFLVPCGLVRRSCRYLVCFRYSIL
jgi:hypothetical protein